MIRQKIVDISILAGLWGVGSNNSSMFEEEIEKGVQNEQHKTGKEETSGNSLKPPATQATLVTTGCNLTFMRSNSDHRVFWLDHSSNYCSWNTIG